MPQLYPKGAGPALDLEVEFMPQRFGESMHRYLHLPHKLYRRTLYQLKGYRTVIDGATEKCT